MGPGKRPLYGYAIIHYHRYLRVSFYINPAKTDLHHCYCKKIQLAEDGLFTLVAGDMSLH